MTSSDVVAAVPAPRAVLGRVPTGETLSRELAAAARSLGRRSSVAAELAAVHGTLETVEVGAVDLSGPRERLAAATGEEERLKERVAAARGDVRARREIGADADATLETLEAAAAELAAVQTERLAAEQALSRARERATAARDSRERRLRLRDRLENRRRDARAELAEELYPRFRAALSAVPGGDPHDAGDAPSAYSGPTLAASLAAVRVADLDGPVALSSSALAALSSPDERSPSIETTPAETTPAETTPDGPPVRPDARLAAEDVLDAAVVRLDP